MSHQTHLQDVEDAARNCNRYGHHALPRHHMVDIGSKQVFLQIGSREKMLTEGEAFPIRLGAGCPPESEPALSPEGD